MPGLQNCSHPLLCLSLPPSDSFCLSLYICLSPTSLSLSVPSSIPISSYFFPSLSKLWRSIHEVHRSVGRSCKDQTRLVPPMFIYTCACSRLVKLDEVWFIQASFTRWNCFYQITWLIWGMVGWDKEPLHSLILSYWISLFCHIH